MSLGEDIDYTIATQDVDYVFAVLVKADGPPEFHVLARSAPLATDALRHVDAPKEAVARSIIYGAQRNGATLQ